MGKSILVIGAAGDVGQGVVTQLLGSGYRVIAAGRSEDKLQRLKLRVEPAGLLEIVVGSVENESSAALLVTLVQQLAPVLDGVVVSVNAPLTPQSLRELGANKLLDVMRANLATHLVAAKSFLPILAEGATYLAIGGGMADFVMQGMGAMSMCQAAQRVMFKVLAEENKACGVRIHELMLYSMIAGESNRATAHPKWITDEDAGRHVVAILKNPNWFPEPIITLKSRMEAGLQPASN